MIQSQPFQQRPPRSNLLWATITLVSLAGWSASLVAFARSSLPMASALGQLNKIDALVDDRIAKTLERIVARKEKQIPKVPQPPNKRDGSHNVVDEVNRIFGGDVIGPVGDQPDDVETIG